MNSLVIKLKYGLTIDPNQQHFEPCPKCGGVVCGVIENNDDVFCVNTFCDFKDILDHSFVDRFIERFEYIRSWGGPMFFNSNYRYPNVTHPFITKEDLRENKLVIREFVLDHERYTSQIGRRAGLSPSRCYKENCPIIARYGSVRLMIEDNWKPDKDGENEIDRLYS